jgi:hypothetical protein
MLTSVYIPIRVYRRVFMLRSAPRQLGICSRNARQRSRRCTTCPEGKRRCFIFMAHRNATIPLCVALSRYECAGTLWESYGNLTCSPSTFVYVSRIGGSPNAGQNSAAKSPQPHHAPIRGILILSAGCSSFLAPFLLRLHQLPEFS